MQTNYQRHKKIEETKKIALAVAITLFFMLITLALYTLTTTSKPSNPQVKKVIDGDTIKLESGKYVRLASIDAPELKQSNKYQHPECGAKTAKKKLKRIVKNKSINFYILEDKEKYDRWIAYLEGGNDKMDINRWMVSQGYANAYYTDRYISAEQHAQRKNKGIHSFCN